MTDRERKLKYLENTENLKHLDYLFEYLRDYKIDNKYNRACSRLASEIASDVLDGMKKDVFARIVSLISENQNLIKLMGDWE